MKLRSMVAVLALLGAGLVAAPAVQASGGVASIALSPADAVIWPGQSQRYVVEAFDSQGTSLGPVPAVVEFGMYESDNPPFGNWDEVYTAGVCDEQVCGPFTRIGTQQITATYQGLTTSTTLRVRTSPAGTDRIHLWVGASEVGAGATVPMQARYEDRYGNATTPGWSDISVDMVARTGGGGSGQGSGCDLQAGSCRATDDGDYFVVASGSLVNTGASRQLSVMTGPAAHLTVATSATRVQPKPLPQRTATITATVTDEFGNAIVTPRDEQGRVKWWERTEYVSAVLEGPMWRGQIPNIEDPTPYGTYAYTDSRGQVTWTFEAGHLWGDYRYRVLSESGLTGQIAITVSPAPSL